MEDSKSTTIKMMKTKAMAVNQMDLEGEEGEITVEAILEEITINKEATMVAVVEAMVDLVETLEEEEVGDVEDSVMTVMTIKEVDSVEVALKEVEEEGAAEVAEEDLVVIMAGEILVMVEVVATVEETLEMGAMAGGAKIFKTKQLLKMCCSQLKSPNKLSTLLNFQ